MTTHPLLAGIYAAMVTPIHEDGAPDLPGVERMLHFLAGRGCHGMLLLGTTGEGPSFSPQERFLILQAAAKARSQHPGLRLLAGTGTPSLDETIQLTQQAFDLGYEGSVVLPPYYFRKVSDDGLFTWFDLILKKAVPSHGVLLGYHIPPVTGIGFSYDLLRRLKDAHPDSFAGIKDSSGNPEYAQGLGQRFGQALFVLTGNDRLFSIALQSHASGCITAMANLFSPWLRQIWETYQLGQPDPALQEKLSAARVILDRYPPMPPLLKGLLHQMHCLPQWPVRPPLIPFSDDLIPGILSELNSLST